METEASEKIEKRYNELLSDAKELADELESFYSGTPKLITLWSAKIGRNPNLLTLIKEVYSPYLPPSTIKLFHLIRMFRNLTHENSTKAFNELENGLLAAGLLKRTNKKNLEGIYVRAEEQWLSVSILRLHESGILDAWISIKDSAREYVGLFGGFLTCNLGFGSHIVNAHGVSSDNSANSLAVVSQLFYQIMKVLKSNFHLIACSEEDRLREFLLDYCIKRRRQTGLELYKKLKTYVEIEITKYLEEEDQYSLSELALQIGEKFDSIPNLVSRCINIGISSRSDMFADLMAAIESITNIDKMSKAEVVDAAVEAYIDIAERGFGEYTAIFLILGNILIVDRSSNTIVRLIRGCGCAVVFDHKEINARDYTPDELFQIHEAAQAQGDAGILAFEAWKSN